MVDAPNSFDPEPIPGSTPPAERPAGFLASTTGKLVVGGIAVLVVLGIIGAIVYIFLLNPSTPSTTTGNTVVVPQVGAKRVAQPGSVVPTQTEPIVDPLGKPLESTFTFRNVFAPTLKEQLPTPVASAPTTSAGTASTTTSSTTPTTPKIPADTLFLQSIQTVNGHTTATFIWNGATYVLAEGDTIPNTPWKVISIGSNSVLMVFGDAEVTLTTGQGLTK